MVGLLGSGLWSKMATLEAKRANPLFLLHASVLLLLEIKGWSKMAKAKRSGPFALRRVRGSNLPRGRHKGAVRVVGVTASRVWFFGVARGRKVMEHHLQC